MSEPILVISGNGLEHFLKRIVSNLSDKYPSLRVRQVPGEPTFVIESRELVQGLFKVKESYNRVMKVDYVHYLNKEARSILSSGVEVTVVIRERELLPLADDILFALEDQVKDLGADIRTRIVF